MKFKRIYLASPYSHPDQQVRDRRFEEVTKIAANLFNIFDFVFLLPITQGHLLSKMGNIESDFERWKTQSLGMLAACHELWVVKMEGWNDSKWVREEINFAQRYLIPVYYIDPELVINLTF